MTLLQAFMIQEKEIKTNKDWNQLLAMSITLATLAHAGQFDNGKRPYITHPLRIMNRFQSIPHQILGVLHDVLEDTVVKEHDLRDMSMPEFIVETLKALTHDDSEDYQDAITRVLANDLAIPVKIADIEDNTALWRSGDFDEREIKRVKKYKQAWVRLMEKDRSVWRR